MVLYVGTSSGSPPPEWVERTLLILCEAVGPQVGTADI